MRIKKRLPGLFVFMLSMVFYVSIAFGQNVSGIDSFRVFGDVKLTIDRAPVSNKKQTVIIFYALPNGNSTAQTMGKKMQHGDDWHYDIQHIRAQTRFIRNADVNRNYMVIYLENDYKSWPAWKQKHPDFRLLITRLVDSISGLFAKEGRVVHLNGHSGGGSFIFGYLAGLTKVPTYIKRISFIDSNYGYDSSYYPILENWLKADKNARLNVFAYNDSIALLNGKPFVSATGGTWWRSHLMLRHFGKGFSFRKTITDSIIIYKSTNKKIQFFLKPNLNRGIYHTQQVELNGFIHSVFSGTPLDSKRYSYYGRRAYTEYIF